MCLAIPSKIIAVDNQFAIIDVLGARRTISLLLMPETPREGEYVLVHAGFAIQKVESDTLSFMNLVLQGGGSGEDSAVS